MSQTEIAQVEYLQDLLKTNENVFDSFFESLKSKELDKLNTKLFSAYKNVGNDNILLLKTLAKQLYQYAHDNFDYPISNSNPSKKILDIYIRETGMGINLSEPEISDLKNYVVRIARFGDVNGKKPIKKIQTDILLKKIDISKPFEFDIEEIFTEILKTSTKPNIERNVEIYRKKNFLKYTLSEIMDEKVKDIEGNDTENRVYPNLNTPTSVNLTLSQVREHLNEIINIKYRLYRHKYLQSLSKRFTSGFKKSDSDFVSFTPYGNPTYEKCLALGFTKRITIPLHSCSSEIKHARNWYKKFGYLPKVRLHIYNFIENQVYIREIPIKIIKNDTPFNKASFTIHKGDYIIIKKKNLKPRKIKFLTL